MKQLQNVIYVLTPDSYLYVQNETVAIKVGGEEKVRVPAHTIESIVCMVDTTVSTPFLRFCAERHISLSFLSEYGRFYGHLYGGVHGNVLLRKRQYQAMDATTGTSIVRMILCAKLANSKTVIQRNMRDTSDAIAKDTLRRAADMLTNIGSQITASDDIDQMRGLEGSAASCYFDVFDCFIKSKDPDMAFVRRSKRPPENNTNALLSFYYALLRNDTIAALECVGLDPAAGYLHTLRPGRPSLALDLMEELRAPLADRLAVSLINLKQINANDFTHDASGIRISDDAKRTVINAWQKRKREEIVHPFTNEKIPIGLIPFVQAQLLARYLRGDCDMYPAFIWK